MKTAFNVDYCSQMNTGIGRYGTELLNSWIDLGIPCEVWIPKYLQGTTHFSREKEAITAYYPWPRRITDYIWPSARSTRSGIQWVHSSNCRPLPKSRNFRQVCMIHDMGPFLYGHMKEKKDSNLWVKRIKRVVREVDCITVNSLSTMNDLLNIFPEARDKVFPTPLGIDHFKSHVKEKKDGGKHILNVGTIDPRKNVDGLLKAYSILNRIGNSVPPLVIAGMDGFRAGEYKSLAFDLKIDHKVIFTGYISDHELLNLYSNAICLVHPAHHEGFGFTVPEAFAWQLPVVAANTGGLGEFFSETAWMVDPKDPESIAHGISMALEAGVTMEQQAKRTEISKTLTWQNCAKQTLAAMKTIGN